VKVYYLSRETPRNIVSFWPWKEWKKCLNVCMNPVALCDTSCHALPSYWAASSAGITRCVSLQMQSVNVHCAISVGPVRCCTALLHRSSTLNRPGSCSRTCADPRQTRPWSSREIYLQHTLLHCISLVQHLY